MKNVVTLVLIYFITINIGCQEEIYGPIVNEKNPPADILNLDVTPIYGGFDVSYDLPSGKDVLYVKAIYTDTNGNEAEVRASAFTNNLRIEGFGDTQTKTVTLYTVDRSANQSSGVSFSLAPLDPIVQVTANSTVIAETYSGVNVSWTNENGEPLAFEIFAENEIGELEIVETIYSTAAESDFSLRDRESVPQAFKISIRDQYGNRAEVLPDTPDGKLTPIKEERLDKNLMRVIVLDNAPSSGWENFNGRHSSIFDDEHGVSNYIHTTSASPLPVNLTIDLGVEAFISRIIIHHRVGSDGARAYPFNHGNPQEYEVFGRKEAPSQSGDWDEWTLLYSAKSVKPSGLPPGQLTDEDRVAADTGEEHEFGVQERPQIRYVRIRINKVFTASAAHIGEFTAYGEITNQDN